MIFVAPAPFANQVRVAAMWPADQALPPAALAMGLRADPGLVMPSAQALSPGVLLTGLACPRHVRKLDLGAIISEPESLSLPMSGTAPDLRVWRIGRKTVLFSMFSNGTDILYLVQSQTAMSVGRFAFLACWLDMPELPQAVVRTALAGRTWLLATRPAPPMARPAASMADLLDLEDEG